MVNGILTFSNNNNVIAIKCGVVGAARYQKNWKNDREQTKKLSTLHAHNCKRYNRNLPT